MTQQTDYQHWGNFEDIVALLLAPIAVATAQNADSPPVRDLMKRAILLQERGKEAFAQLEEVVEDLRAEVEAELAEESNASSESPTQEDSEVSQRTIRGLSTIDTRLRQASNGMIDARSLTSMMLGVLALRQLLTKGLQLDDLPWYVLAWYSFDSFMKFHDRHRPSTDKEFIQN